MHARSPSYNPSQILAIILRDTGIQPALSRLILSVQSLLAYNLKPAFQRLKSADNYRQLTSVLRSRRVWMVCMQRTARAVKLRSCLKEWRKRSLKQKGRGAGVGLIIMHNFLKLKSKKYTLQGFDSIARRHFDQKVKARLRRVIQNLVLRRRSASLVRLTPQHCFRLFKLCLYKARKLQNLKTYWINRLISSRYKDLAYFISLMNRSESLKSKQRQLSQYRILTNELAKQYGTKVIKTTSRLIINRHLTFAFIQIRHIHSDTRNFYSLSFLSHSLSLLRTRRLQAFFNQSYTFERKNLNSKASQPTNITQTYQLTTVLHLGRLNQSKHSSLSLSKSRTLSLQLILLWAQKRGVDNLSVINSFFKIWKNEGKRSFKERKALWLKFQRSKKQYIRLQSLFNQKNL